MWRIGTYITLCLSFFVLGWFASGIWGERAIDRTVAMSWGDGKYGKNFYGAHVFLVPIGSEFSVRARVYIGHGKDYYHEFDEIGRAESVADAIEKWGTIHWSEKGLDIGNPNAGGFHCPQERMEAHR